MKRTLNPQTTRISYRVLALSVIGFALSAGLFTLTARSAHFDGLYGQDPYAYYDYGTQINALITRGQGLGHFYWPLGYPTLIGLSFMISGVQASGAQMVSLLCSAFAAVLTGLLTLEVTRALGFAERRAALAGITAWALMSVCGQLIQSSIVIMSDAPALMWAVLSAWALTVYGRTRHPAWIALASFALAWAIMTRWQYAGLAPIWIGVCALFWKHSPRWRHAALAVIVGLLTLTPQIIHSSQNPDPVLHHMWLEGWSPANAFARDFVTADGSFHYDQPIAIYYLLPITSPYYMNALFVPLIALGLVILLRLAIRKFDRCAAYALLIVGWIGVEYGFLAGIPYQNIRFALSFFPPLALLAGIGAAGGWQWITQRIASVNPARAALGVALSLIVLGGLANSLQTASGLVSGFVANKDRDLAAVQWAQQAIPEPHATVYSLDLVLTMQHYSSLDAVQIYYETPTSLAARLPTDRPAYALFNVWTTEHQWQGKTPWIIYHWLADHPGLTEIGTYSIYTLYRIGK